MGVQGREWGPLLLRELNQRVISGAPSTATAVDAGAAVDLDPLEVAAAMTWLIEHRLVQTQSDRNELPDPYTDEALEPTFAGLTFLAEHPF